MSQGPGAADSARSLLRELGRRARPVRDRWWLPLAGGLVSAPLGLAVLAAGPSVGSLAVITGVLFIVGGAAVALNPAYAAGTSGGHVPGATWVSAGTVIGVQAAVTGIIYCVLAFEVRTATRG
jgi:uncharacterized membrane protein HdeD (DUF308 family)